MGRFNKKKFIFIFPAIIACVLLVAWVVMLLWNAILPSVIHVNAVTYPQAVGILVLSKILFGGFRGGPRGGKDCGPNRFKEKLMNMSEEERASFKEKWAGRCGWKKDRE